MKTMMTVNNIKSPATSAGKPMVATSIINGNSRHDWSKNKGASTHS